MALTVASALVWVSVTGEELPTVKIGAVLNGPGATHSKTLV
jgi:hypothetical protein